LPGGPLGVPPVARNEVTLARAPMPFSLARARTLILEVPRTAKLAYCLMRDERVPVGPKVATGAALFLIASPLDVPAWIPVIGDLDVLALGILTVKVFVDASPERVVEEHRDALQRGDSLFDRDVRIGLDLVGRGIRRLVSRGRPSLPGTATRQSEDKPA
jgi:uncharacterized membrane protein YkvA (DUF1232 family)